MIHVTFKTEIDKVHERNLELEERIRELEAQVKANYTVSEKRGQSIAKAREILQDTDWSGLEADLRKTIKQVWEALEGK